MRSPSSSRLITALSDAQRDVDIQLGYIRSCCGLQLITALGVIAVSSISFFIFAVDVWLRRYDSSLRWPLPPNVILIYICGTNAFAFRLAAILPLWPIPPRRPAGFLRSVFLSWWMRCCASMLSMCG